MSDGKVFIKEKAAEIWRDVAYGCCPIHDTEQSIKELLEEWQAQQAARAEPVAYLTWHQGMIAIDDFEEYLEFSKPGDKSDDGTPAFPVYTTPQPPKAVPDSMDWNQATGRDGKMYSDGWNDCRRAMLKGQEGES